MIPFTQQALGKLLGMEGTRLVVHDPKTQGLRAELREGGTIAFYIVRRIPGGGPVRLRIGPFPEVTVEAARIQAADKLAKLLSGEDIAATRRTKRGEPTLKELFEWWLEKHAKGRKKTWDEDQRMFDRDFSQWHNRKLTSVTKADVVAWHARKGKDSPYQANRVLALLRTVYNAADDLGYTGPNPCKGIKPFPEESRDRFLQPDELPRFFQAIAAEPTEKLRDFFLLALFTGQRRTNVLQMKWADIDLPQSQWRIPDTKQGKVHYVPLPEPALAILRRRKESAATAKHPSEYVLPGHVRGDHLKDPMKAWRDILERAGIENLRIHDLRRTLGSYAAINGASLAIIGGMLGHSRQETTAVYARLTEQKIADTFTATAKLIESHAKPVAEKPKRKRAKAAAEGGANNG